MENVLKAHPHHSPWLTGLWWTVLAVSAASFVARSVSPIYGTFVWLVPFSAYLVLDGVVTLSRTRWTFWFLRQVTAVAFMWGYGLFGFRHGFGLGYVLELIFLFGLAVILSRGGDSLARRYWPKYEALFRAARKGVRFQDSLQMRHIPVVHNASWWADIRD